MMASSSSTAGSSSAAPRKKYDDNQRVMGLLASLHLQELAPFLLQLKRRTGGRSSLTLAPLPSELSFHTADLAGQLGTMGAPAGDPGACTLSFRTAGSAAALVWVVSRTVEGVQLLRLGKAGPDHIPRSIPVASPRDLSGSPCGVMRWNRAQGGPDLCTRDMLLYLIYVACRMAKRRPKIKTTVESPQDFLENLRRFRQGDEHEPPCEVPPSEGFFFFSFGALRECELPPACSLAEDLMERASSWSASQRPSGGQGRRREAQEAPSGLLQRALSPSKVCSFFSLLQNGSDSTGQDKNARRETRWPSSTTSRARQRRWASLPGPCERPAGRLLPPSCWRRCAGSRTSPSSPLRTSVPSIEKSPENPFTATRACSTPPPARA